MLQAVILAACLLAAPMSASAQIFNPATPTGPPPILPPTPPAAVPGMNPQPPRVTNSSRTDQLRLNPGIDLGIPSRETHNDRSIRCSQQGAALGLPPGSIGQYVRECVNSP